MWGFIVDRLWRGMVTGTILIGVLDRIGMDEMKWHFNNYIEFETQYNGTGIQ